MLPVFSSLTRLLILLAQSVIFALACSRELTRTFPRAIFLCRLCLLLQLTNRDKPVGTPHGTRFSPVEVNQARLASLRSTSAA